MESFDYTPPSISSEVPILKLIQLGEKRHLMPIPSPSPPRTVPSPSPASSPSSNSECDNYPQYECVNGIVVVDASELIQNLTLGSHLSLKSFAEIVMTHVFRSGQIVIQQATMNVSGNLTIPSESIIIVDQAQVTVNGSIVVTQGSSLNIGPQSSIALSGSEFSINESISR